MKKTYIQPASESMEFAPQSMMASSPTPPTINSDSNASTVAGGEAMTNGIDFEDDIDWNE